MGISSRFPCSFVKVFPKFINGLLFFSIPWQYVPFVGFNQACDVEITHPESIFCFEVKIATPFNA